LTSESIQPPGPLVKAGIVVLIIGLLYTAYVAVCWGLADWYAEDAHQILLTWNSGEAITEETWQAAHTAMETALYLDPSHPTYLHRMGRLYHIRMMSRLAPVSEFRDLGQKSKEYYRESIGMRRTWPLTWANLALVKRDLGEFDAEMEEAVTSAVTYGPWEPGVHRIIAVVGVSRLHLFSEELRVQIAENVRRGLMSPTRNAWSGMDAVLKRFPYGVRGEVLAAISELLVEEKWQAYEQVQMATMGFWLWPKLNADARNAFLERLIEAIKEGEQVSPLMNLIQTNDKTALVCPRLPRTEQFRRYCMNSEIG
jgi:hypothetical protein